MRKLLKQAVPDVQLRRVGSLFYKLMMNCRKKQSQSHSGRNVDSDICWSLIVISLVGLRSVIVRVQKKTKTTI